MGDVDSDEDRSVDIFEGSVSRFRTLDRRRREDEERLETATLCGQTEVSSPRAEAEQLLQYYAFHANANDVNYFFDRYTADWRIPELAPMAMAPGSSSEVILELFAALHRLRNNSNRHLLNYNRALRNLSLTLQDESSAKKDWLKLLACVLLMAQYEVNYRRGKDLSAHLQAAANLFSVWDHIEVPESRSYQKRTLERVLMIYDLQHNLVSGDALHLPLTHYQKMYETSEPIHIRGVFKLSLDQLWSEVHLLWAKFAVLTQSELMDNDEVNALCADLATTLLRCRPHSFEVGPDSGLHSFCPFGSTIIYKSPALRLVGIFQHTLALMLCSWSSIASLYFQPEVSRDHIMRAHAPLFTFDSHGRRMKDSDKFVPQAFPAILHIMIAASEVRPEERQCQQWICSIMQSAKEIGYSLGHTLLLILQSHAPVGDNGLWEAIGCRRYILSCRYLRQQGLA